MAMPRYAVLLHPAANRVYAATAPRLLAAETAVVNQRLLGGRLREIDTTTLAGVDYLTFTDPDAATGGAPEAALVAAVSMLSSVYALYALGDDGSLRPVPLRPVERFDSDLISILKYSGKTNEQFTRMLINLTVLATAAPAPPPPPGSGGARLRLLDPLCGRGTTLNQALRYGYHATGIDTDGKDIDAYAAFLRGWLTSKRLKHRTESGAVRRHGATLGRRFHASIGETKELYRAGDTIEVSAIHADTRAAGDLLRPASVDLLVTDLPYGVQHGSRAGGLSRSPLRLLAEALPVWRRLLAPGAAVGIAFNTLVAPRPDVVQLLGEHGFAVVEQPPGVDFAHRVAQAVLRDVVLARPVPATATDPPPAPRHEAPGG